MADFLDLKRKEIDDRLAELRPLVQEAARLETALAALDAVTNSSQRSGTLRSGSRRDGGTRTRTSAEELVARRRRALALIGSNPGITARELALLMELRSSTLYNFLRGLENENLIEKDETSGGYRVGGPT